VAGSSGSMGKGRRRGAGTPITTRSTRMTVVVIVDAVVRRGPVVMVEERRKIRIYSCASVRRDG
jgi:hypothetical protein